VTAQGEPLYQDRIVVITGTRKGLGRLLADHFLERGAVVIGISRGETTIAHARYEHHTVDVGDDRTVREAFLTIGRSHGRVDIVINNAAVVVVRHALMTPASQAEEMVRTNLLGCLYISREAAKLMRQRAWGRIINIGSIAAESDPVGEAVYAASKSASMTLAAVLAKEFATYGITVNTVAVTALETDMLRQLPERAVSALLASLAIPRLAMLDDIINVIDFFASPRSGYITAQTIFLGGIHR
jgi:3-oxoacyl-[acyl-carrier protein] reductase